MTNQASRIDRTENSRHKIIVEQTECNDHATRKRVRSTDTEQDIRSTPTRNTNREYNHGPDMTREIEKEQEEIHAAIEFDTLVDVSVPKDKGDGDSDKHDKERNAKCRS